VERRTPFHDPRRESYEQWVQGLARLDQDRFGGQRWNGIRSCLENYRVSPDRLRYSGNCPRCEIFIDIHLRPYPAPEPDEFPIECLDHVLLTPDPMMFIERMSPPVSIVPPGQRRYPNPSMIELPHPTLGTRKLLVSNLARELFATICLEMVCAGLEEAPLPDWHPHGSDEQFDRWRQQVARVQATFHNSEHWLRVARHQMPYDKQPDREDITG